MATKNKYVRVTLHLGFDSEGKQLQKQFYGKSKRAAEAKKLAYIKDTEAGIKCDLANLTLENAMYKWLWIMQFKSLKEQTFEREEGIYRNYIKGSQIANIKVSDFTALIVQDYYNYLDDNGKSTAQIRKLHKLLNKFFGYAVYEGYTRRNPCYKLKIKEKETKEEIQTFTPAEIERIKQLPESDIKCLILLAFATGMRLGEILALEYGDIKNDIITINKTLSYLKIYKNEKEWHYENKVQTPKTKSSVREVPLPKKAIPLIKKIKKLNATQKLKMGSAYINNNLLFPSALGTFQDHSNCRQRYKKVLKEAGVKYKKFHATRHTYATQLLERGENIVNVGALLGHASIKTTEVYVHVSLKAKEQAVERLSGLF